MTLLKKVLRNKAFYIIALIIVIMAPQALYNQGQTFETAIATSIGLDKSDEGVEVTIVFIVPQTSGQLGAKLETSSASAENVSLAMEKIAFNLGKTVGLAHCEAIVINKELFNENVATYLDFFYRTNNLTINSTLMATNGKAKDVMQSITTEKNNLNLSLRNLADYSNNHAYNTNMNVDEFYINYFNPYKSSVINMVEVEEESQTSGGSQGGSESSSQGESQNKKLKSEANLILVNSGKLIKEIKDDELEALNILNGETKKGLYKVENFSNETFKNVDLVLEIANKDIKTSSKFNNGIPIFNFDISVIFKLEEIKSDEYKIDSMYGLSSYMSESLQNTIKNKIDESLAKIIKQSIENNCDILGICDSLYKYNYNDFVKYTESINSKEVKDILKGVVVTTNYDIRGKI